MASTRHPESVASRLVISSSLVQEELIKSRTVVSRVKVDFFLRVRRAPESGRGSKHGYHHFVLSSGSYGENRRETDIIFIGTGHLSSWCAEPIKTLSASCMLPGPKR